MSSGHLCRRRPKEVPLGYDQRERLRKLAPAARRRCAPPRKARRQPHRVAKIRCPNHPPEEPKGTKKDILLKSPIESGFFALLEHPKNRCSQKMSKAEKRQNQDSNSRKTQFNRISGAEMKKSQSFWILYSKRLRSFFILQEVRKS